MRELEAADSQAKAALIRQLLRQGRVSEVPDVANNDLIRRIAEQRVTANAQLALESGTLLPGHPRIRELRSEIINLDAQLRLAADNIAIAEENNSKIAACQDREYRDRPRSAERGRDEGQRRRSTFAGT